MKVLKYTRRAAAAGGSELLVLQARRVQGKEPKQKGLNPEAFFEKTEVFSEPKVVELIEVMTTIFLPFPGGDNYDDLLDEFHGSTVFTK